MCQGSCVQYLLGVLYHVLACANWHLLCCCCCACVLLIDCLVLESLSVCTSRCDERADVFSLGVVLWELITHEPPRRGQLRDIKVPLVFHHIVRSSSGVLFLQPV